MSDITLELGPSNGDPVDFEVGATAADPITFEAGPGGAVDLTNYARLDQANRWTAGPQTITQDVEHVPFADIATTDLPIHVEAVDTNGGERPIWQVFSSAVEVPGVGVFHGAGARVAEVGPDGERTGRFLQLLANVSGFSITAVESGSFADAASPTLYPLNVGTPTAGDHAATKTYADGVGTAAQAAAAAALSAEVSALEAADLALSDSIWLGGIVPAVEAPTRWLHCVNDTYAAAYFATETWQAPPTLHTLRIRATFRVTRYLGGEVFFEIRSESLDGMGDNDRYEVALWLRELDRILAALFAEGTAAGAPLEWQRLPIEGDNYKAPPDVPFVAGPWTQVEWLYDFDEKLIYTRCRDEASGDYESPIDGTRWRTLDTYTHPNMGPLHDTNGDPSWLCRCLGTMDVADTQMWCDDVLVSDPDIAGADIGDTSITDTAAGTTWLAVGDAAVDGVDSGAVDSVNGQTGTVVLAASDVGAVPTTRTVAGHALSGDVSISAADVGALASNAATGWAYRANIPFAMLEPKSVGTSWTPQFSAASGGGFAQGGGQTETWVYEFPLAAGTYKARCVNRHGTNCPIIKFNLSTLGDLGNVDTYNGSTALNQSASLGTGLVIPTSGYYTLTLTCATRNVNNTTGYMMTPQLFEMVRTGA